MAITKADVTQVFNGQSDIILFDAPEAGYTKTTTFAQVVAAGVSLGQVVEDSTSWEGEEAAIETIADEQGDVIVAQPTAGTFAFACDVANVSPENLVTFLKGANVSISGETASIANVSDLVKFGTEIPVITRPIAIANDEANKFILFPKAKIVSSLSLDSKLWRIHISATAEYVDTTELGTVLMGKGTPTYAG